MAHMDQQKKNGKSGGKGKGVVSGKRRLEKTAEKACLRKVITGDIPKSCSPSFIINDVCGYHYTPSFYRREAKKLRSYGFVCLHNTSISKQESELSELWILPFLSSAKGKLAKHIEHLRGDGAQLDAAVEFLNESVSCGSLDVTVQRYAITLDGGE